MPFYVIKKDITEFNTDAIVNSANTLPVVAEGVEAQIYNKAGIELLNERKEIGEIQESESRISNAYNLNSKYVIHTVSPIYEDNNSFKDRLEKAYLSALKLAIKHNLESIAFPLLSGGTNGCPRHIAIEIAIDSINRFLREYDIDVYLVLYKPYRSRTSKMISHDIRMYLREQHANNRNNIFEAEMQKQSMFNMNMEIDEFPKVDTLTFQQKLFKLIDEKDYKEVEVYKQANMSRKLFSKIRSDKCYQPKKTTAIALCLALGLDLDETEDLLDRAGYSLTESIEFDLMIKFFIEKRIYNIIEINLVLHEYGKNPL
ncbi:O-acetyl-ADP-ribose deacetylase [Candidatus Izimaplasma bacterium HR1]|jgi:O-acetyl-ADP-ribose deacetylase (regulator of RNase III)|uniref:macro domain-containing protein n=1 Tax=Candidatus Izimoplasma sp. HR1 TaxID=1541959 RepID=UPI0004F5C005|nr:O-acetyl-ADP-ribose deacetylase [Candidatus Izimaplasma bacterium HR1]